MVNTSATSCAMLKPSSHICMSADRSEAGTCSALATFCLSCSKASAIAVLVVVGRQATLEGLCSALVGPQGKAASALQQHLRGWRQRSAGKSPSLSVVLC